MDNNEVWRLETGYLAAYTEDRDLMRRVKRYKLKRGWREMATYSKNDRLIGIQYRVPMEQSRQLKRMWKVEITK